MKRSITVMILGTLACGMLANYAARSWQAAYDNFDGVGGLESYEKQRAFHLERIRSNAHVSDTLRNQDAEAIEAEIQELGRGLPAPELGAELRRVD